MNETTPPDFPSERYDRVLEASAPLEHGLRILWSRALLGVRFRFRACADHDERFARIIGHGRYESLEHRYHQEHEVAAFVVFAHSTIECLAFALYITAADAFGTAANPTAENKLRTVTLGTTLESWKALPLGELLAGIQNSSEWRRLKTMRNQFLHRGHMTRAVFLWTSELEVPPDSLGEYPLEPALTGDLRAWVARTVDRIFEELEREGGRISTATL